MRMLQCKISIPTESMVIQDGTEDNERVSVNRDAVHKAEELAFALRNNAVESPSSSSCAFQTLQQKTNLLPEIRIDTSRLDELLSGFQRRLGALETAFSRVAESAAEAAHKVSSYAEQSSCICTVRETRRIYSQYLWIR